MWKPFFYLMIIDSLLKQQNMIHSLSMNITCAILAGGYSKRMGKDKATLEINGKPLLFYVFETVKHVFRNIVIVSNNHSAFKGIDVPVVKDIAPVSGTMTGIVSALVHAHDPYVFVCACDMPFMTEYAIRHLINEIKGEDIIIPKTEKGYEPLHAIYSKSCISYMLKAIEQNRLKIDRIFPALNVKELNDSKWFYNDGYSVFTNINSATDLEKYGDKLVKPGLLNAE